MFGGTSTATLNRVSACLRWTQNHEVLTRVRFRSVSGQCNTPIMRIFISSVIVGLEPFRDAAATSAIDLGHEVRRAEDFGASAGSPQQVCLEGVRWADLVVVLLGGSYGAIQASGLSATHEEFHEGREESEVLAFVQSDVDPDPPQVGLIDEVSDWKGGVFTGIFSTPDDLAREVTKALHQFELGRAEGVEDPADQVAKAQDLVARRSDMASPHISLGIVPAPSRLVLRPSQFTAELAKTVHREAAFGEQAVLDTAAGTTTEVNPSSLALKQADAEVFLDEHGAVIIMKRPRRDHQYSTSMPAFIEEEVQADLERYFAFADWLLGQVDGQNRLSTAAIAIALTRAGMGWRTRSEHQASPNSMSMPMTPDPTVVTLPQPVPRASIRVRRRELTDDLIALLRRGVQGI